jgi:hypothetical protein
MLVARAALLRYIAQLKDQAELRKRADDVQFERRQLKDRAKEDHLFEDKEVNNIQTQIKSTHTHPEQSTRSHTHSLSHALDTRTTHSDSLSHTYPIQVWCTRCATATATRGSARGRVSVAGDDSSL